MKQLFWRPKGRPPFGIPPFPNDRLNIHVLSRCASGSKYLTRASKKARSFGDTRCSQPFSTAVGYRMEICSARKWLLSALF